VSFKIVIAASYTLVDKKKKLADPILLEQSPDNNMQKTCSGAKFYKVKNINGLTDIFDLCANNFRAITS